MLVAVFFIVAFLLVAFGGLMAAVDAAISVQSRADIADLAEGSRSKRSLLAIAADYVLLWMQHRLTPKGIRAKRLRTRRAIEGPTPA